LSGLLIASDVVGALHALASTFAPRSIVLVGASQLTQLYATTCRALNIETLEVDGVTASLAGLTHVYRQLLT
jgi:2-keto-3-deoxy-galactonokinase